MKRPEVKVEKRKLVGRKVKSLRKDGIFPANIYGKKVKSVAVQLPYKDFQKVFKEVGETGLVDVLVAGEVRPSLIHNVQYDYLNKVALHADFYQVDLKTKVKTMVPVVAAGVAKAVSDKLGLLLQPLSEIEIEALPTDLPEKIEVDVTALAVVDAQITIAELKVPSGVTILTSPTQVVVKIGELISKEAAEQAAAEAAAKEAAKAESAAAAATTEGEVAGETKPEAATEAVKTAEAAKPEASLRPASPKASAGGQDSEGQAKSQK